MLKLICGEAGTGKSTLLGKQLREAAVNGKNTVYIVPDQFSFEAEKQIYRLVPHEFSCGCRVTTFAKEARRILHLYGETKEYADDIAKRIAVKLALEEAFAGGELEYYRGQVRKEGFPAFALSMISDMRGAGMTPSLLRSRLAEENGADDALTRKLNDIAVIYSAYDNILTRNFDDKLDDVRRASEIILDTDIFDGAEVFIDEFDSFSGNQTGFIRCLLDKAENVTIALTCDYPECRDPRFEAVCKLIGKLAGDGGKEVTLLKERYRKPSELRITEARDKWQECDWICAEIRALTDSGVRCREIAVLAPDSGSTRILDSTMRRYEIPAFADIPEPLITKSFVRFCIYTLKALSFTAEDILRYIKSGFVRGRDGKLLSDENVDIMEMLCSTFGLRGKDWLRPFPERLGEADCVKRRGADREMLEELRKDIIEPLKELKKAADNADGAELTKLLCDFICNKTDVRKTLYGKCVKGHGSNGRPIYDPKMLDEYSELWDDTVTVFESAFRALRGHHLPLEEYIAILTDVFTATTVAKPPQTLDAVTVGDTERSRFSDVKYVFICGFARGIMPPPARLSEVFTPSESEKLAELGIPVASDRLSRYAQELFTVYRCVNLPSERLYITYPALSENGTMLSPAPELAAIADAYGAVTESADSFGASHYCRTRGSAERYLAHIYGDPKRRGERDALLKTVSPEFAEMLRSVSGERPDRDRHRISDEQASKLLTMERYSPSAIRILNSCKFEFFCKYGLGLADDGEREITKPLVGNVIHYCLQQLFSDYLGRKDELVRLGERELKPLMSRYIAEYEQKEYFGDFGGSSRFSYLLGNLGRYAVRSAGRLISELSVSGFEPRALEQRLTFPFGGITVSGICDRTDTAVINGTEYVRIIDYKRKFDGFALSDIFAGKNMQALLYLFAQCENNEKMTPSSAYYVPVGRISYIASDGSSIDTAITDSMQADMADHSPAGLILTSSPETEKIAELNTMLNARLGSARKSYISPRPVSDDAYAAIEGYCRSFISSKVAEISRGMVSACPSAAGDCEYCQYSVFCGRSR